MIIEQIIIYNFTKGFDPKRILNFDISLTSQQQQQKHLYIEIWNVQKYIVFIKMKVKEVSSLCILC